LDNIGYHLEEASNKLAAAKSLLGNGFYKDSVSRSYYSMYHAARALLLTKHLSPKTHEGMVAKFGLEFVKKNAIEKFYSKALAKGKDICEIADYDVITEITEEEAKSLIEDAEKFLERIKRAIREMDETK
jgi:uncharacterized protein (UPF0332 family)